MVAGRLADALDGALLTSDLAGIERLSDRLARWLPGFAPTAAKSAGKAPAVSEGVTPTDGEPRPVSSLDEQYARLCAELDNSAES